MEKKTALEYKTRKLTEAKLHKKICLEARTDLRGSFDLGKEIFDNYTVKIFDVDVFEDFRPIKEEAKTTKKLANLLNTGIYDAFCLYSPAGNEDEINEWIENFYNETVHANTPRKHIAEESFTVEMVVKKKAKPVATAKKEAAVSAKAVSNDDLDLPTL